MKIISKKVIEESICFDKNLAELILLQKNALIDFSARHIYSPMPLQMSFKDPPGDCHIKAGFNELDEIFIVKVATGFYKNKDLNLPAGDGAILVFSKTTGLLQAILCDNGYLTILRTALAACVASQIAPVTHIGIIGTGNLSKITTKLMQKLYPEVPITIWGRTSNKSVDELLSVSDLVITTTASQQAIVSTVRKNAHIIALGADELGKQELEPVLFKLADRIIVDSKPQAILYGDSSHAIKAGLINEESLEELGSLLATNYFVQNKLIITDLTGIAAQDMAIAKWVLSTCKNQLDPLRWRALRDSNS